jgi:hypothetical protein
MPDHIPMRITCDAGAHRSWFHLYRVLLLEDARDGAARAPGADAGADGGAVDGAAARRSAAVAVEQFVQTAPLGEFERRLELLHSFRRGAASSALVCIPSAMFTVASQLFPETRSRGSACSTPGQSSQTSRNCEGVTVAPVWLALAAELHAGCL